MSENNETSPLPVADEARILAWVAGEASAFEAAEMERLCASDPRAARFREEMLRLHGLLAESTRPPADCLSEERRQKVLAALGAPSGESGGRIAAYPLSYGQGFRGKWQRWAVPAGAVAAAAIALLLTTGRRAPVKPILAEQRVAQNGSRSEEIQLAMKKWEEASTLAPTFGARNSYAETGGPRDEQEIKLDPFEVDAKSRTGSSSADPSVTFNGGNALRREGLSDFGGLSVARESLQRARLQRGYEPNATLAGTRVQTNLQDFASSIDVLNLNHAPSGPVTLGASSPLAIGGLSGRVSTLSLHVGDASFRLAAQALARGEMPDPATVRPEEFYNAFDYRDPAPAPGEAVACQIEQSTDPFHQQRNLIRLAIKVPRLGRSPDRPLNLTLLLDISGSMQRPDRVATVEKALTVLTSLLRPGDRVTLVGYAAEARLLADRVSATDSKRLVDLVRRTPADGGSNLTGALNFAAGRARLQGSAGAENRLVVLTDGLSERDVRAADALGRIAAAIRGDQIKVDACGIGTDGAEDPVLETISRKGEGRYYVLNSPRQADADFARQLAGGLRPVATDVKLQVRFNPKRVQAYHLIGFDGYQLAEKDFRNDRKPAAELSADQGANALYEVTLAPGGQGDIGRVSARFRQVSSGQMIERSWPLPYLAQPPAFDQAPRGIQLAGAAAFLAEKLRGGPEAAAIHLATLGPLVDRLAAHDRGDGNLQILSHLYEKAAHE